MYLMFKYLVKILLINKHKNILLSYLTSRLSPLLFSLNRLFLTLRLVRVVILRNLNLSRLLYSSLNSFKTLLPFRNLIFLIRGILSSKELVSNLQYQNLVNLLRAPLMLNLIIFLEPNCNRMNLSISLRVKRKAVSPRIYEIMMI